MSRQRERCDLRSEVWSGMSGPSALTDEKGIIPRRVRRSMALGSFRRKWVAAKLGRGRKRK